MVTSSQGAIEAFNAQRLKDAQIGERAPGGPASPLRSGENPTVRPSAPVSPNNPDPSTGDSGSDDEDDNEYLSVRIQLYERRDTLIRAEHRGTFGPYTSDEVNHFSPSGIGLLC